jgi:hypothetical protein
LEIPELEEMRVAQVITIASEMTTAMSPYDKEHRKDFGLDVRTNLTMGRSFTNVDYIHAQRMRTYGQSFSCSGGLKDVYVKYCNKYAIIRLLLWYRFGTILYFIL